MSDKNFEFRSENKSAYRTVKIPTRDKRLTAL